MNIMMREEEYFLSNILDSYFSAKTTKFTNNLLEVDIFIIKNKCLKIKRQARIKNNPPI